MKLACRVAAIMAAALLTSALSIAADSARIYVYARRDTPARSWMRVSCDGAPVAELKQGKFFALTVSPGRYALGIDRGVPLIVEARAGEELFVRLDWNYGMERAPIPVLAAVRPDRASTEMKYLSYISRGKALSKSVARSDPRTPAPPRLERRGEP